MEKLKGKNFAIFVAILLFLIFLFGFFLSKVKPKEATLIIDFGGDKRRVFTGETVEGMTVFDALLTSSKTGKFDFKANGGIISLGGVKNQGGKKWECFLNQRKIEKGLKETFISPGDKILCKYE